MNHTEIINLEIDGTTRQSQQNAKAKAVKPCPPEPEFLDFDPGEAPCITVSKTKAINNKFLFTAGGVDDNMFSYDDFVSHDTIIMKNCTGTGKTTATANH